MTVPWWREPGSGAYARLEREWRWLLSGVPADAGAAVAVEDRYLLGSTMRLRHMHDGAGHVYKLTQKVRPRVDDPSTTAVTNVYLTAEEHALLSTLAAAGVAKVRHRWSVDGIDLAVDELRGRWHGIVLAELEHDSDALQPDLPGGVDVTFDNRFTGGALAAASDDDAVSVHEAARALLAS